MERDDVQTNTSGKEMMLVLADISKYGHTTQPFMENDTTFR